MKRSFYLALLSIAFLSPLASVAEELFEGSADVVTTSAVDLEVSKATIPGLQDIAGGPDIVTLPIAGTFCSGSTVVVNFTTPGTTSYGLGNVFTAQLSDLNGDFTTPTTIGSINLAGVVTESYIFSLIPNGLPFGSNYRIRVVSSEPAQIGSDNGTGLTIKTELAPPIPTVTLNGPTDFCFGSATTFISSSAATGNLWFPGGVNTNPFIGVVSGGCYYTQVTGANACATSSVPVCIEVNTPIFTFLGYFENGQLVTTTDTTVTICEGDSAEIGVIIEGGVAPFDIFYTPDGFNFETVNDVGNPSGPNTHTYSFYTSQPGFYQIIGITDNFPTNCGSNGNSGLVTVQTAPRPVTDFSYEAFCGPVSGLPVPAPSFLAGGIYSFDVDPGDGATVDPATGVISNATIGNTYIIRYTAQGPFCEALSTASITVDISDITDFTIDPFCSNALSPAPTGVSGFAAGGTYSFVTDPADGSTINAATGIISNASGNTTYNVVYTSPAGVCQASSSYDVTTLASPSVTGVVDNNTQCGEAQGVIATTTTGGTPNYSFLWSNGETTEDINQLVAGAYTITVTDDNGCTDDTTFTIINTNEPDISIVVTNASCGENNGSLNTVIVGGSGAFDILWDSGETTLNLTDLAAGTYSVTVTDIFTTCEVTTSASVANQDAPEVTFTSINTLCTQSTGSIDVTVVAAGPVTHSWSNGETTEDLVGIPAGTYTDTISDGTECDVIITVTITNTNQFTASSTVTNPTCAAPSSGSIDVSIVGGTTPFQYAWTPNTAATTQDVIGLASGEYTVEIEDAAGCLATVVSTIAPLNTITLDAALTDATCGNADGAIDLIISGGSGNYTILWSTTSADEDITDLTAGTYSVSVTDQVDASCVTTGDFTIVNGNEPQIEVSVEPSSCIANSGAISLAITGGSGSFDFAWSGPNAFSETTQDISGLEVGSYSVIVSDQITSCVVNASGDVTLANPPSIAATVVNTTCGSDNGIIDITVTGGTEPFTIVWDNGAESLDQINLAAGNYAITITDGNGCEASGSYTIEPSIQPTSDYVAINPTCGTDTGSITVTLFDAVSPITYNWTLDGAPFASFANLTDLAPGTYILAANDGNGCTVRDTVTLNYPNLPQVSSEITNTQCGLTTGAIDVTVTGGTGVYTFAWDGPDAFASTDEDLLNLGFGCYNLVVTDENGCEASTQACVENENAPEITFTINDASCNLDNGTISTVITGGVEPYTLSWTGSTETTSDLVDLAAGTYTLTVTDDNGCETSDSAVLINTGIPTLNANQTDASCGQQDGSIDLIVSGGEAPYIFIWSPGGELTEDLSGLAAGDYNVIVTDNALCDASADFTIGSSLAPQITFTQVNPECGNPTGSIDVTVTEGSGDYTYEWSGVGVNTNAEDQSGLAAGDYTLLVTDNVTSCTATLSVTIDNSNSFDVVPAITAATCGLDNASVDLFITGGTEPFTFLWCNGATEQNVTGLAAGSCQVVVSDASGCELTLDLTIDAIIAPTVTGSSVDATCGACNGTIDILLTDAIDPVSILWSNGSTATSLTDLCADTYTATITDGNGCELTYSATINDGPSVQIDFVQVNTVCGQATGSIDVTISGGVEPYQVSWNGPGVVDVATEDITDLAAGDYTLNVTDDAGCTGSLIVSIINGDDPVLSFNVTDASCGAVTGAIDLSLLPLTGTETYSWTGPDAFVSTDEDLVGVSAGVYNVEVTAGNCIVLGSAEIINSDAPSASITISNDTICAGAPSVLSIDITGNGPFTFVYSDGTNDNTVTSFDGSSFTVPVNPTTNTTYSLVSLISDLDPTCLGNFPIGSASIVVNPTPTQPTISVNGSLSFCQGGSVVLTSSETAGNIWSQFGPDQFNQSITVTESGVYFVESVNSFGCSDTSETVEVVVSNGPVVQAGADTTVCAGSPIQFNATGADEYVWSPSIYLSGTIISNPVCTPFDTTTYVVTGTNECGTSTDTIVVNVIPSVNVDLGDDFSACPGVPLTLVVELIDGATYTWSTSATIIGSDTTNQLTIVPTSLTTVTVTATNTNGCVTTDVVQIDLSPVPVAPGIIAVGPTTVCEGEGVVLQATTGNFVVWSNGLENFDEILVTESGDYYVTAIDGNCPATSDTITVVITPLPAVDITFSGPTTVCEGECVTLSGVGAALSWTLADGSTDVNSSISACETGMYYLSNTENACTAVDSVQITIIPTPEQPIITIDGLQTICANQTTTLVSSFAAGNQWAINSSNIQDATDNTLLVSIAGLYSVTVTNAAGCTSTSEPIAITVKPISPLDIFAAPDSIVCGNVPVNVELTASSGFDTYTWSPQGSGQTITADGAGLWTVNAVTIDGCEASSSITIIVAPTIELDLFVPVIYDDYNVSVLGGNDGSIDLSTTGQGVAVSYAWTGPSGFTSTSEDLFNLYAGLYTINVTDEYGCVTTETATLKEPGEIVLPNGFTPNGDGFNDFYKITGIQGYPENQINIFNRWGSLVYSAKGYTNTWDGLSNDGNQLPDGTYFIVVDLNTEGKEDIKGYIDLKRK